MNHLKEARAAMAVSLLFAFASCTAQHNSTAQKYAERILSAELKKNLSFIASDSLEGRKTGTVGQKIAASFIRTHFQDIGLKGPVNGSYFQPVPLYRMVAGVSNIKNTSGSPVSSQEFVYLGLGNNDVNKTNLSFIGNGQDSVTQKMNLKDKAVLVVSNNRVSEIPISELLGRGVKLILVCNADSDNAFTDFKKAVNQSQSSTRLSLTKPVEQGDLESVVFISPSAAANLTGIPYSRLRTIATEKGQPDAIEKIEAHTITYRLQNDIEEVVADNVLGYLEGSDKKDELVVITAHYDHIGKRATGSGDLINNGADDDGSGTVAVMELARVFAEAKASGNGPLRSMLFMTVTGEEIGLLGSQYYTDYPVFPLSKTVVDLNIDMIGRSDAEHKDNADYVYVIGSDKLSSELHQISESINSTHTKLAFDYTYNDVNHPTNLYKRSDHWNFAKHDIPIIFYFDGIHEDYHKPSDEVDKIDFDILRKRAQLIFYTAWELAYRKDRIKNDKE